MTDRNLLKSQGKRKRAEEVIANLSYQRSVACCCLVRSDKVIYQRKRKVTPMKDLKANDLFMTLKIIFEIQICNKIENNRETYKA